MIGPYATATPSQWPEIIRERRRVRDEAPASSTGTGIGQGPGRGGRPNGHRVGGMMVNNRKYVSAGHWKRSVC